MLVSDDVREMILTELDGHGTVNMGARKQTQGPLRLHRRCIADHFETLEDEFRKNDEYPFQLIELRDVTKLLAFLRSRAFHHLSYTNRSVVIRTLQCQAIVPDHTPPPVGG